MGNAECKNVFCSFCQIFQKWFWKRVIFISVLLFLELQQVIASLKHALGYDLNLTIVKAKRVGEKKILITLNFACCL